MALKASIFKLNLDISDMDRHYYANHTLTVAQHPSENDLRMLVRILAFALNAHEDLAMTKGLSSQDEPDVWLKTLSDEIDIWIDLGQPDEKRIRQACGKAKQVRIYTYNDRQAGPWFKLMQSSFTRFKNLTVQQLPQAALEELVQQVDKNMDMQISIQDGEMYISLGNASVNIEPVDIYPAD